MKLTRCLMLLSLAAIVCVGPGLAQDGGVRDTMWFEVTDWPINTGGTSDTSVAIELWVWTDDSLGGLSLPFWVRFDMSDCGGEPCDTTRWGFNSYEVPFEAQHNWYDLNRWATSVDSLFEIDNFIFDPGLPTTTIWTGPTISSIHVRDSATNFGYNGFLIGAFLIPPNHETKVLPTETRTKIGDLFLTVNLENDSIMPDFFNMILDSAYYAPAGDFKLSPHGSADAYQPYFIPGVVHVTAGSPKDAGGSDPGVQLPISYELSQNYPNPFNPTTTIKFSLEKRGSVDLSVYNILGRKVKTLVSTEMDAGPHDVLWDGTDNSGDIAASGVYFYKLQAGDFVKTKKMLMLK